MNKVTHKMIKVLSARPILAKGGIMGPLTTPYNEDTGTIFRMISDGLKVVEIFKNGTEVELNATNFDKENEVVKVVEEKKPTTEQPKEIKVEQPPVVQTRAPNQNKENQNFKNKNKNKGQQKPVEKPVVKPVEEKPVETPVTEQVVSEAPIDETSVTPAEVTETQEQIVDELEEK